MVWYLIKHRDNFAYTFTSCFTFQDINHKLHTKEAELIFNTSNFHLKSRLSPVIQVPLFIVRMPLHRIVGKKDATCRIILFVKLFEVIWPNMS
jgi:hypothetical protein